MLTRSVNLTGHYDRFVDEQVASGQFKNAREVMRAGLGMLERKKRLAAMRGLSAEGFDELDHEHLRERVPTCPLWLPRYGVT